MRKVFFGCFFMMCLLFSSQLSFAQDNCTDVLKRAQRAYDDGNIENVEQILKKCMANGFTKDQMRDAYRLIILSNLYDEKIEAAEETMTKFLQLDPEYEIDPAIDPEEFGVLFDEYVTSPLWSWGVVAGINRLYPRQLEEFGTYNTETLDYNEFKSSGLSFHAGLRLNRYVADKIEVEVNALLEIDEFTFTVIGENEFDSISQVESQTNISIPLSFTYDFLSEKKWRPYGRLGMSASYLLNASANNSRTYIDGSDNPNEEQSYNDLVELRKRLQLHLLTGLGVKFKISKAYIFGEFRYRLGLNNQVIPEDRVIQGKGNDNYDRLFRIRHEDSDFSLDKVSFSVGIAFNVYNPRKKKIKE